MIAGLEIKVKMENSSSWRQGKREMKGASVSMHLKQKAKVFMSRFGRRPRDD